MQATARTSQWLLWSVFLLTIPVPYYMGEVELAPTVRLIFIAGLFWAIRFAEGASGTTAAFSNLASGAAVAYMVGFWLLAWIASRLLQRIDRPGVRAAVVGAIVAGLLIGSLFEIYDTPLSSSRIRSNIIYIFR